MDLFSLYENILALKSLERKGWLLKEIPSPESVADHSYAVSILTMVMAKEIGLDVEKCLQMSLIHDLPESKTKDITPHDDIPNEKKQRLEKKAAKEIFKGDLFDIWEEYHEGQSTEAKLVKDMDKIEMLLQALNYEKKHDKELREFFEYVKPKLNLKQSKELFTEIVKKRT